MQILSFIKNLFEMSYDIFNSASEIIIIIIFAAQFNPTGVS